MRKTFFPFLLLLAIMLSFSCSSKNKGMDLPDGVTANYLYHTGMMCSGDYFFVIANDGHFRCYGPFGEQSIDSNAVEAVMAKELYPIGADEESFFFVEVYGAERYGKGSGRRVYRYFPIDGRTELVARSTSVSNTDGLLGLEDVLSIDPLIPNHPNYGTVYYAIDGYTVMPGYMLAEKLLAASKDRGYELILPDTGFKFAISKGNVFFADALNRLYAFDGNTSEIRKLDYASVSAFFIKQDRLFVLADGKEQLDVLDITGTRIAQVDLDGHRWINAVTFDDDDIYLLSDGFEVLRIDGEMKLHSTGFSSMDYRWCVKNGIIYTFYDGIIREILF